MNSSSWQQQSHVVTLIAVSVTHLPLYDRLVLIAEDREPEEEGAGEARKGVHKTTRNVEIKKAMENYSPQEIDFD
ncbi:hypothetical protein Tco_0667961 [Tanacetum coccineum]